MAIFSVVAVYQITAMTKFDVLLAFGNWMPSLSDFLTNKLYVIVIMTIIGCLRVSLCPAFDGKCLSDFGGSRQAMDLSC
jgi:hypothetical protein